LNELVGKFESDPQQTCCDGGLYIVNGKNLHTAMGYGENIRIVTLPFDDKSLKVIKDRSGNKWRVNKLIFKEKYSLADVNTYILLHDLGVDISRHEFIDKFLTYDQTVADLRKFPVRTQRIINLIFTKDMDYLDDNDTELHDFVKKHNIYGNYGLYADFTKRNLNILSRLLMNNHDKSNLESIFISAVRNESLEIVKLVIETENNGIDIDQSLRDLMKHSRSVTHYTLDIVKYLISKGAKVSSNNYEVLREALRIDAKDIVMFLKDFIKYDECN